MDVCLFLLLDAVILLGVLFGVLLFLSRYASSKTDKPPPKLAKRGMRVIGSLLEKIASIIPNRKRKISDLCSYLPLGRDELVAHQPQYEIKTIPKRSGGSRVLHVPDHKTKRLQRALLTNLINRLSLHSAVTGFRQGKSIVDNASPHVGREVIVKLDIIDFFPETGTRRVRDSFAAGGWDRKSSKLIEKLTCYQGGLPQGAPTSPAISNYVNKNMDLRLAEAAGKLGAMYTRYADDITYSFVTYSRHKVHTLLLRTGMILRAYGYRLNKSKKRIIRAHRQQLVTGLVVNERVNLPRKTRRWLRAVQHRLENGGNATLTNSEFAGWLSLVKMVDSNSPLLGKGSQSGSPEKPKKSAGAPGPASAKEDLKQKPRYRYYPVESTNTPSSPEPEVSSGKVEKGNDSPVTSGSSKDAVPEETDAQNIPVAPARGVPQDISFYISAVERTARYSQERKQELSRLEGVEFEISADLHSVSRTFSFSVPEPYRDGQTLKGELTGVKAGVELYCKKESSAGVEAFSFPVHRQAIVKVLQWNQIFKRIEAILIRWRDE